MSEDSQVLPSDPPKISAEFTIQQKTAIKGMMAKAVEKVLAANSAKEHNKGKGGPGAILKHVEKDHE